ncbi:MAG TPA: hypothetical protein VFB08_05080 [Burkholderiales bacterium]|nr:hypothetical protein [Burkholderiales bacterium]
MKILIVLVGLLMAAPALAQRKAALLEQGRQIGKTMFEPGDTDRGGTGQPVDGIEGSSSEMLKTHYHAHLALFYRGEQIAIPYGIGIVKPFRVERGFVGAGSGYYWLHTHDATGIIHIEAPEERDFTLGNFFDIWGRALSPANVAGLKGKLRVYVDGKPFAGDPRAIVLKPHEQITLEVGEPAVTPPTYAFPEGL